MPKSEIPSLALRFTPQGSSVDALAAALLLSAASAPALEVVLDFTMDEQNYNWFDPTPPGLSPQTDN
jgi:hypothetical protein